MKRKTTFVKLPRRKKNSNSKVYCAMSYFFISIVLVIIFKFEYRLNSNVILFYMATNSIVKV
jgi:hypothetical protein